MRSTGLQGDFVVSCHNEMELRRVVRICQRVFRKTDTNGSADSILEINCAIVSFSFILLETELSLNIGYAILEIFSLFFYNKKSFIYKYFDFPPTIYHF